ncbi:MAG TPA: asparagine synthase (glutamine-hydrolyzing) [Thermoanaerobaculia bacterium]|nr:asparagine synthase (glutamine-hydrolyzing) [Thermoanaerobaculia bacterium]
MCGIFGFTGAAQPEVLAGLEGALRHRGPDDAGSFTADELSLGATRLAIIGREDGRQPLSNEDGSLVLVCNGEIYNHRALRRQLERRGHRLATGSDAEVVLHLYEEEGAAMLSRLEGMFALALWDAGRRRLLLARDAMGMKPLLYARHEGRLYFASEAKALFLATDVPRQLDAVALEALVGLGFVPGERTLFAGVRRLPAGCCLCLAPGRGDEPWSGGEPMPFAPPCPVERGGPAGAAAAAALRGALEAAVESHLEAEVPLGASLSGGLDSSVMVALMARLLGRPFPTYTIGFAGDQDERGWARRVAEHCGTEHRELTASGEDLLARLPAVLWHLEEPRNGPMAPGDLLFERVRGDGVEVVLIGEGADELFGGYHRLKTALPPLGWLPARAGRRLYLASRGGDGARRRLVGPELQRAVAAGSEVDATLDPVFARRGRARAEGLLRLEQEVRLPEGHLMRNDRLAMAHGLETRLPYLDPGVVALARSMPLSETVRWRGEKHVLREAARGLLPDDVRGRRKEGQRDPLRRLLRAGMLDLAQGLLAEAAVQRRGLFASTQVGRLLRRVAGGAGGFAPMRLNLLVLVELWHRVFLDPPRLQPPAGVASPPVAPAPAAAASP